MSKRPTLATAASYSRLAEVNWVDFDGNVTMDIRNWMFPNELFEIADKEMLVKGLMMTMVEDDNLAWAVFPPKGYRVAQLASESPGWETGVRQMSLDLPPDQITEEYHG